MTVLPTSIEPVLDDQHAMRRYVRAGDPRAFEGLVRKYQGMVLATCLRVMRSEADAEDAVQETFFKFARSAGHIRSNIGAWLHACALGTARDLLRTRGSRARAEHERGAGGDSPVTDASWSDVQTQLDEAIGHLHEDDRELIIARFLVGRAQIDMANDAGISPGAMHRRIDKALERLRAHLSTGGLAFAGAAIVATLDRAAQAAVVSPQLSGSLMKVGLAATAFRAPATAGLPSLTKGLLIAAAFVVVGGGSAWLATHAGTTATTSTNALAAATGTPRPTAPTEPMNNIRYDVGGEPIMLIESDGRTLRVAQASPDLHTTSTLLLMIVSADDHATPMMLDMEVIGMKVDGADGPAKGPPPGQKLRVTALVKDRDLTLTIDPEQSSPHNRESEVWRGRSYAPPNLPPIKPAADPIAPKFVGRWAHVQFASLVISPDDVTITSERATERRFRILEWTDGPDYAKVQAICADSTDARWVGKRIKMLVRESPDGYTLAFRDATSRKINEWPTGFESTKDDPLHISTWRKDAP